MSIKDDITVLEKEVNEMQNKRDEKSLWLFIATVGCWGIPKDVFLLQLFAFTIILLYYFRENFRITNKEYGYADFNARCNQLKEKIRIELKKNDEEINNAILKIDTLMSERNKRNWLRNIFWFFSMMSFAIVVQPYMDKVILYIATFF
ncbi:hypothetical protein [Sulfuricurvum sp.]|uniref:hypothetical protein n=1 Tax=Sulfuricurvum sp. TaxID=2025608 RepID=UPI003BAE81C0